MRHLGVESVKGCKRLPMPAANNKAVVIRFSLKCLLSIRIQIKGLLPRTEKQALMPRECQKFGGWSTFRCFLSAIQYRSKFGLCLYCVPHVLLPKDCCAAWLYRNSYCRLLQSMFEEGDAVSQWLTCTQVTVINVGINIPVLNDLTATLFAPNVCNLENIGNSTCYFPVF